MRIDTFIQRILSGKVNNLTYSLDGREGLVSVWKHGESCVLTWEECPAGEQYNESNYTRDERHVFAGVQEVLEFVASQGLRAESFTP